MSTNFAIGPKLGAEQLTAPRAPSAAATSESEPPHPTSQGFSESKARRPTRQTAERTFRAKQLDPRIAMLRLRIDESLKTAPATTPTNNTPPEEGFLRDEDDFLVFNGTHNDDKYRLSESEDGQLVVENLASGVRFSQKPNVSDEHLQVKLHDGDDRLTIDESVRLLVHVDAGAGNDHVDAGDASGPTEIQGGPGQDVIFGGPDDDIISGGPGRDIIAGGGGRDQLMGDAGNDGLLGGPDEDYLWGGAGQDMLIGGPGSDAIYAGKTDHHVEPGQSFATGVGVADGDVDTVVTEMGGQAATKAGPADTFSRFSRADAETWLADHPEIKIVGSPDFEDARIADIGVLLSTKQGSGLLNDLSQKLRTSGTDYEVVESRIGGSASHSAYSSQITISNQAQTYGEHKLSLHPLPALHHELVHAYQHHVSGLPEGSTLLKDGKRSRNVELQATGLPWIDSQGKLHKANELKYTENKFRAELGLKAREAYGTTVSPPASFIKTNY